MPDLTRHVSPGEAMAISAETWNAMLDSAKDYRLARGGVTSGGRGSGDGIVPACEVYVRNDSPALMEIWSCVAIGDSVTDAVVSPVRVKDAPVFSADVPAASTDAFAIVVEPIADGQIGRAVVLGVVPADVDVSDAGHGYAAPGAAVSVLESGTTGPARILWKESGTGTVRAVVLLEGTAGTAGGGTGFFARLTTETSGRWDFYRLKVNTGTGLYVDDGAEVTGNDAYPLQIDGTNLCNPVAGLRVWMIPGTVANTYEFLPVGYAADNLPGVVGIADDQVMGDGRKQFYSATVGNSLYGDTPRPNPDGSSVTIANANGVLEVSRWAVYHGAFHGSSDLTYILGGQVLFPVDASNSINGGTVRWEDWPSGEFTQFTGSPAATGGITAYIPDDGLFTISPNTVASPPITPPNYAVGRGDGFGGAIVVYEGINGTRTVKDGSGNNKVVTIKGGIITDWQT